MGKKFKIKSATITVRTGCAKCKKKKKCDLIKEIRKYQRTLRNKIKASCKLVYAETDVVIIGFPLQEVNPSVFWIELDTSRGKMLFVPPEDAYICNDIPEEHQISYA